MPHSQRRGAPLSRVCPTLPAVGSSSPETHLFHDRLLRLGPARVGDGATIGPESAVLPDTVMGAAKALATLGVTTRPGLSPRPAGQGGAAAAGRQRRSPSRQGHVGWVCWAAPEVA